MNPLVTWNAAKPISHKTKNTTATAHSRLIVLSSFRDHGCPSLVAPGARKLFVGGQRCARCAPSHASAATRTPCRLRESQEKHADDCPCARSPANLDAQRRSNRRECAHRRMASLTDANPGEGFAGYGTSTRGKVPRCRCVTLIRSAAVGGGTALRHALGVIGRTTRLAGVVAA
jgi:hypothetical protein